VPDEADEEFSDRAKRLTPREWRVVALSIEGVAAEDACAALGIAEGTLKSHKQAIRRKLGVPRGKRLERHLREHMEALPASIRPTVAAAQQVPVEPSVMERRVRLLLRLTLQELLEVADNAELRAALLQQTVQRIASEDAEEARREVEDLQIAAREIRNTFERVRADIRARGRQVSQNGG
jgi:DNA-binding CsgD family transcriptional regulator